MLSLFVHSSLSYPVSDGFINSEISAIGVELTIDYGNSTQEVFPNLSGTTAYDILNQSATVTFIQYAYGKFVLSINSIENNANNNGYYWQYWVNDELGPIASDNYVLSDDDEVLWKYCSPAHTTTPTPSPNLDIIFGLGIIGLVGIIIAITVLMMYLKMR